MRKINLQFRLLPLKLLQLALITGLITIISSYNPLPAYGDVTTEIQNVYQAAIKDAEVPEYSEIYQQLTAITKDNPNLVWEGDPGKSRLKVVTWTNYNGYKLNKNKPQIQDIWVTVFPELKNFCTQYVKSGGKDLSLRLKQLLGLNPNRQYSKIVEMWVDPKFLFRPTADPEISDREAELISPVSNRFTKIDQKHQDWLVYKRSNSFQKNEDGTYNDDAQPWTALGYTYDWGNPKTEVGLSEFVIEKNKYEEEELSSVEVISITSTADYCQPAGDISDIPSTPEIQPLEILEKSQQQNNQPSDILPQATAKNLKQTMLIPNILNIAINLFFVYFALSLFLSALQEQIVVLLAFRAKNLKSSIQTLLGDGDAETKLFTNELYQNPLIKSLNQQGGKWLKTTRSWFLERIFNTKVSWESIGPSYLNSKTFSDALLELLNKEKGLNFEYYDQELKTVIKQLGDEIKRRSNNETDNDSSQLSLLPEKLLHYLYALARKTQNNAKGGQATIRDFQTNIAAWFDESMERATGVYKRNTFALSLILGCIIAFVGNIDTIYIVNQLYNDPALNETLSGFVEQTVSSIQTECQNQVQKTSDNSEQGQDKLEEIRVNCLQEEFNRIDVNQIRSFPIGWETQNSSNELQKSNQFSLFNTFYLKRTQSLTLAFLGWFVTAFALAQGAPFWFDLLNKFIEVRSSGRRYDSKNNPNNE